MFADLASAIFTAIFVSWFLATPLTYGIVAGAIAFAFLPDIDYLAHLSRGGTSRNAHRHRELLHYPLLYIPAGAMIASVFGAPWVLLFAIASFLHFLHDSIGIGWGVQWLYPFRKDHYTFLYRYQPRHKEPLPRRWAPILVWKHEDIDTLAARYGDENWIRNIYLYWYPYAIAEFLFFLGAAVMLYWYAAQ